jgi:hypothetical protein
VAETMAIRDAIQAGGTAPTPAELEEKVKRACDLGAGAEAWKLTWVIVRKRGRKALPRQLRSRALRMWWQCEYTLPMRLFLLVFP